MKKKLISIVLMILTCAALALGVTACGGNNDDIPADGNMAKVVLREYNGETIKFIGNYAPKGSVTGWGYEYLNYTMDDIIGSNLPFNNYGMLNFDWKTGGYRITKVEFDLTAQSNFKSKAVFSNYKYSVYSEINVMAGQTQHIVFNVNLESNNYGIGIGLGANADAVMRLVNTKISNFYVTAEKV